MRILPVLDLKGGVVVHGVAGRRAEYQPVVSVLTDSSEPVEVARAFRDCLGLSEIYVADLDAIAGGPPAFAHYAAIRALGCRILVDAGVRDAAQARRLAEAGIDRIIVGLETVAHPAELARIVQELGPRRVMFSLDLRDGQPLGDVSKWESADADAIARRAVAEGIVSMIVLDLARVGVGLGLGTEKLCRRLREDFPELELIVGGGVRCVGDLQALADGGMQAALVASALHDGRITRMEIERL